MTGDIAQIRNGEVPLHTTHGEAAADEYAEHSEGMSLFSSMDPSSLSMDYLEKHMQESVCTHSTVQLFPLLAFITYAKYNVSVIQVTIYDEYMHQLTWKVYM